MKAIETGQALDGSFSILNWHGYPSGIPKPKGPFKILQGREYVEARNAANKANQILRKELDLAGKGVEVHEIVPVKFGGDPVNINNKIFIDGSFHRKYLTPFWNKIMRGIK